MAGPPGDRWAFWDGRVFHLASDRLGPARVRGQAGPDGTQTLSAPMPATVVKVLVAPGSVVRRGDTLIVLEAMKMELPLRAAGDATVTAVRAREGELVQPDAVLIELN